jgi:hypothetical protein
MHGHTEPWRSAQTLGQGVPPWADALPEQQSSRRSPRGDQAEVALAVLVAAAAGGDFSSGWGRAQPVTKEPGVATHPRRCLVESRLAFARGGRARARG